MNCTGVAMTNSRRFCTCCDRPSAVPRPRRSKPSMSSMMGTLSAREKTRRASCRFLSRSRAAISVSTVSDSRMEYPASMMAALMAGSVTESGL